MTLCFFAAAADVTGSGRITSPVELKTVGAVRRWLDEAYPDAKPLWAKCLIAVDQAYSEDDTVVGEMSEVAIIPPVSGG
jgi:molybdopterin converting factor subunit 1